MAAQIPRSRAAAVSGLTRLWMIRTMHMRTDQLIQLGGFTYVGLLAATAWWYGSRRSRIARYLLAALIFLPAVLCLYGGLSLFSAIDASHHTPDAVYDPSGLAAIIGLGIAAVGAVLAIFGIRVLIRPLRRRKDEGTA
jgi:hypothetical protein